MNTFDWFWLVWSIFVVGIGIMCAKHIADEISFLRIYRNPHEVVENAKQELARARAAQERIKRGNHT
jgi:hypothetical protein